MFSPRALIAELALVAGVAAAVVGVVSLVSREPTVAPPATQPPASALPLPAVDGVATSAGGDVRLLVKLAPQEFSLQANISGELGMNYRGCVTVNGRVLIAPFGATVSADGGSVNLPHRDSIRIGENLPGIEGGEISFGRDNLTEERQNYVDHCGDGGYTVIGQ